MATGIWQESKSHRFTLQKTFYSTHTKARRTGLMILLYPMSRAGSSSPRPAGGLCLSPQSLHLPDDHDRGDGRGRQVGGRAGQPDAVYPQKRRQDQQQGDEDDHLAQQVEEHGDPGLAYGLEEAGADDLEAHYREGGQKDAHPTDTYLHQERVAAVEQADEQAGEELDPQETGGGDGGGRRCRQLEGPLDPLKLPGAVVEADDRLGGHVDGDDAEDYHHGHAVDDPHGPHRQVAAVPYKLEVEQGADDAPGQLHGEGRHPDGEYPQRDPPLRPQVGGPEPERTAAPEKMGQHPKTGGRHGDDGGQGRPGHPHPQDEDEERVQQDVGRRPDHHSQHGGPGVPLGPDQVVHPETQALKDVPPQDDGEVLPGVAYCLRAGSEQRQHNVPERQAQDGDAEGDRNQQGEGVPQYLFGLRPVLLAQPYGDQGAGAHAHQHPEGHGHDHHRKGDAEARQGQGPDAPAYVDAVYDVVEGVGHHPDDGRHEVLPQQSADRGLPQLPGAVQVSHYESAVRPTPAGPSTPRIRHAGRTPGPGNRRWPRRCPP